MEVKKSVENNGDKFVFFHNPNEENAYLSNWYYSKFKVNGTEYTSMEQYMMHQKALLFKDIEIAEQIMKTDNFGKIKALGRKVRGFDTTTWDYHKREIIHQGVLEKFKQNTDLKEQLLNTGNAILAECAVNDKIWAIGLSMTNPKRFDITQWKGQNLLGEILMQVRSELS